jgi:hypothetical protein
MRACHGARNGMKGGFRTRKNAKGFRPMPPSQRAATLTGAVKDDNETGKTG